MIQISIVGVKQELGLGGAQAELELLTEMLEKIKSNVAIQTTSSLIKAIPRIISSTIVINKFRRCAGPSWEALDELAELRTHLVNGFCVGGLGGNLINDQLTWKVGGLRAVLSGAGRGRHGCGVGGR